MAIAVSTALFALFIAVVVVFLVRRWGSLARHGRLAVPCDEVIELPAGEVVIHFEDSRRLRVSERPEPPLNFSVLVSEEPSGRRIELIDPDDPTAFKGWGRHRAPFAAMRLPRAGGYRVITSVGEGSLDPHITFG